VVINTPVKLGNFLKANKKWLVGVRNRVSQFDPQSETLYLQSIPDFVSEIKKAEQSNDWVSEAEFMRTLDGLED
jgi:hypothetical protein